jgi:penicillin-binding protein 2
MASRDVHVVTREMPPELLVRPAAAVWVAVLIFALVGVRLWYLQVERGAELRSLSESNRIRTVRLPAARGFVSDRHGELLIDNRPSFDVVFVPEDARDRRTILRQLATHVGESEEALLGVLRAPSKRPPYEGVVLLRDVEWREVVALETYQLDLPGVSLRVAPRRYYPFGPLAAHLLGYVGEVSERDLAQAGEGIRRGDIVGKSSLEREWDVELRGVAGGEQVEVDSLGRRVRLLRKVDDVPGSNLVLTLDWDLQQEAEQALGEHDGSVVVLEPHTGEILAMVSHPAFDPNVFARGVRRDEWRALIQDAKHPLNNRAVQGQYPPGSTFKIAVAAAALNEGVVSPGTGFGCGGGLQFGGHYFKCWKKTGHGGVAVHRGIVESCDVYFYQVGQRLGVDRIADYARRLGLGLASGIALRHEKAGLIPDSQWKQKRFRQPWYAGETLSVAIGQGYVTATPLQMAQLAAMVANSGIRYRPHYVKRVEGPDGTVLRHVEPEVLGEAGLKPSTLEQLRAAMRDVVMKDNGTGKRARVAGIEVAGKTGTAQAVGEHIAGGTKRGARETRDHAWFIAFAPVEAPEIALAALVEHAGEHGGTVAAPIAGRVFARYFNRRMGPRPPQVATLDNTRPGEGAEGRARERSSGPTGSGGSGGAERPEGASTARAPSFN